MKPITKSQVLSVLASAFPTYCALFPKDGSISAFIMVVGVIILMIVSAVNHVESDFKTARQKEEKGMIQLAWIIHIVGIFIVIAAKNI